MKGAVAFIGACAAAATLCACSSSGGVAPPGSGQASPQLAARYNTELAYGYMREGRMDIAQQKLALALKQAPQLALVHDALAFYYEKIGDSANAERQYRLALRYDPNDPNTLNNFGAFLCRQGDYRDSLDYFARAAADLDYNTPDAALANAGMCALKIPDAALAEEYFSRALAINPDSSQALWQLGLMAFGRGDYEAAHVRFARLVNVEHEPPAYVLWTIVETDWMLGDRAGAQFYGNELIQRFPDSPETEKFNEHVATNDE